MPTDSERRVAVSAFMILILLGARSCATAEEAQISAEARIELTASLDREQFPQNETCTLTVTLQWLGPPDAFDIEPLTAPNVDNLRIVSSSSSVETKIQEEKEITLRKYDFVLRGESPGVGTVGRIQVNYRHPHSGQSSFLETQPIQVRIGDPVASTALNLGLPLSVVGIAIVVTIVVFAVYRSTVSRRRAPPASTKETSPLALEQRLLKEVCDMEEELQNLPAGEFYDRARSITLNYLEEKYGVGVKSSTAVDVLAELEQRELPKELSDRLRKVLQACEEVRFASKQPSEGEKEECLSALQEILELER